MLQNVDHTTETIGSIRESRTMINGQQDTREYTDAEKAQFVGGNRPKPFGMDWMDKPTEKVESMIDTAPKNEEEGE